MGNTLPPHPSCVLCPYIVKHLNHIKQSLFHGLIKFKKKIRNFKNVTEEVWGTLPPISIMCIETLYCRTPETHQIILILWFYQIQEMIANLKNVTEEVWENFPLIHHVYCVLILSNTSIKSNNPYLMILSNTRKKLQILKM